LNTKSKTLEINCQAHSLCLIKIKNYFIPLILRKYHKKVNNIFTFTVIRKLIFLLKKSNSKHIFTFTGIINIDNPTTKKLYEVILCLR